MNRFWNRYTGPLLREIAPARIIEIGADLGWNTRHLLQWSREVGAALDIVDTKPSEPLLTLLEEHGGDRVALHVAKSLDAIPALPTADVVMLDGDHNWRTVYAELSLFWSCSRRQGDAMPIVIAHDCAWPYARRDMYYNPDDFAENERHPFAYKGMLPGVLELVEDGMNGELANALVEGGPENGVLTAIEDFRDAHDGIHLWTLPFFNGLGIIVPTERLTESLRHLIESFYTGAAMLEACRAVEADGMRARAETLAERRRLQRRTDALLRARELLEKQARRIAELEREVAHHRGNAA